MPHLGGGRWATFIGLAMLLLCSPATGFFVKKLTGLRRRMLLETDSRVKLMNQLLTGIRVLKLYAWEAAQEAAVCLPRSEPFATSEVEQIPDGINLLCLLELPLLVTGELSPSMCAANPVSLN